MLIVFSDVDGCLLDRDTYSFAAARPALAALRAARVPLVLCSSKTRHELRPLACRLGLRTLQVVENGGALVVPAATTPSGWTEPAERGDWSTRVVAEGVCVLGVARDRLIEALPDVARDAGVEVRGFSVMTTAEVRALTGLSAGDAARALCREFDEPFVVPDANSRDLELDAALDAAARTRGLRVSHGGRLYHLHGPTDKGSGLRAALALFPAAARFSVGLGDAASDLPLLAGVERPILVPGPCGLDPVLARALPHAERAPAAGPVGWNAALLRLLAESPSLGVPA